MKMIEFQQLIDDLKEINFPYVKKDENFYESINRVYKQVKVAQNRGAYPSVLSSPLGAQFELTYRCNLKCKQCYNQSGLNRNTWNEVNHDIWCNLAEDLGKRGLVEAVISGGEPLLSPSLFDVMDILDNYGVKFIFITNCFAMNDEIFNKLLKYEYSKFQISIDGSRDEIHDKIRGANGSFKKAAEYSIKASQCGLPLTIAHCAMKENINDVGNMIDLAYLLGASEIISDKFMPVGRGYINYNELQISESESKYLSEIIMRKRKQYQRGMEIKFSMPTSWEYRYRLIVPCDVLLFRPNGDAKVSCVLPFKAGNILDSDIESIWNNACNIYKNETVLDYISKIKTDEDILKVHPIPHVDHDYLVGA